jgi:hypothetical protein
MSALGQKQTCFATISINLPIITTGMTFVIAPSHKHRHGTGFQVHIWLTIPPHENIFVNHTPSEDARHEHVEVAIKDAFASARRQVDDLTQAS